MTVVSVLTAPESSGSVKVGPVSRQASEPNRSTSAVAVRTGVGRRPRGTWDRRKGSGTGISISPRAVDESAGGDWAGYKVPTALKRTSRRPVDSGFGRVKPTTDIRFSE